MQNSNMILRSPRHPMSVVVSPTGSKRISKPVILIHVKQISDGQSVSDLLGPQDEILVTDFECPVSSSNFTRLSEKEIKQISPAPPKSTTSEISQADETPDDGGTK